jgi:Ca-activated chloride channel family protein
MFMPKLGTMRPRNKLSFFRVVTGLQFSIALLLSTMIVVASASGQTTSSAPAQTSPKTNTPSSTPPASARPQTTPAQNAPAPDSTPAAPSSPSQTPAQNGAGQPAAGQVQGQAPDANDNGVFVFKAEAREVVLHATVVDEKNHLVMNLTQPDFTVYENDKPQQISSFRQTDFPVAMGIVIDNSGSMREKREEVNKAAINLVRSSNPGDAVFVVNFNDEFYLDQDFTADIKKLQAALEHVETRGGTALYDAIIASADYLMKSNLSRKVLFVVTDGEDDASQSTLEQAVQRVSQENGPTVYCIGLLGDEKVRRAKRALDTIAERTGGIAFFPPTLDQVDEISSRIAHDIRNQYTISYRPSTPKSVGGYRTIHVEAHARPYKRLSVRTRSGYYPGQEAAMR